MRQRNDLKPLYDEIKRLFEEGYSYTKGAAKLGIPSGSFAGTINRLRARGVVIERTVRVIDARHRVVDQKPTLPKLRFMEEQSDNAVEGTPHTPRR